MEFVPTSSTSCPSRRSASATSCFSTYPPWSDPTTIRTSASPKLLLRRGDHVLGLEAEFLLQFLEWTRCSERAHADHAPAGAGVPLPPKCRGLFDGDPGRHGGRQHSIAVLCGLIVEQFPGEHAD